MRGLSCKEEKETVGHKAMWNSLFLDTEVLYVKGLFMKTKWFFLIPFFIGLIFTFVFPKSMDANSKVDIEKLFSIKWGSDIVESKFFVDARYEGKHEGISYYSKTKDQKRILGYKVKCIHYGFYNDKFCSVIIGFEDGMNDYARGYNNYKRIKEDMIDYFGQEYKEYNDIGRSEIMWNNEMIDSAVVCEYREEDYNHHEVGDAKGFYQRGTWLLLSSKQEMLQARRNIAELDNEKRRRQTILDAILDEKQEAKKSGEAERPEIEKELIKTIWDVIELTIIYNQKEYELKYETTTDNINTKAEDIRKWTLEKYHPVLIHLDEICGVYINRFGGDEFRDLLIRNGLLKLWTKQETAEEVYYRLKSKTK